MDNDPLLSLAAGLAAFENEPEEPVPARKPAPPKHQPGAIPVIDDPRIVSKRPALSGSLGSGGHLIKAFNPRPLAGSQQATQGFKDLGQGSFIQKHAGVRVKNPLVSSSQLESRLSNLMILKLSQIKSRHHSTGLGNAWCTLVVIGEKSPPRESGTGRNYAIWKVTDLEQTSMTVFMFGAAYDDHFRETEGMVVALVAPKTRTEGGEFALTVDRGDQVWVLGRATDFGYCKAQRKDGNPCRVPVNVARCPYCVYHVSAEYNKMRPMRKELQGGSLHTAFSLRANGGANSSGLQWAPGRFDPASGPKNRMTALSTSQLQGAAQQAASRGSAAGAKYVRTVADPQAARAAAADVELMRLRRNKIAAGSAPIPLPRTSNVMIEERANKRRKADGEAGKGFGGDVVVLEDEEGPEAMDDARQRAIEFMRSRDNKPKATVPKYLAAGVKHKQQQEQAAAAPPGPAQAPKQADQTDHTQGRTAPTHSSAPLHRAAAAGLGRSIAIASSRPPSAASSKPAGAPKSKAPSSAFAQAFGNVIQEMETACAGDKNKGSLYASAVDAEDEHRITATLDALEKQDEAAAKMDSIKSIETQAWKCSMCKYTSEWKRAECSQLHPQALQRVKVIKRWWKCGGCGHRFTTVGQRYPTGRCPKCDVLGTDFIAVSMLRVPKEFQHQEDIASKDKLLVRGEERKWVNQ